METVAKLLLCSCAGYPRPTINVLFLTSSAVATETLMRHVPSPCDKHMHADDRGVHRASFCAVALCAATVVASSGPKSAEREWDENVRRMSGINTLCTADVSFLEDMRSSSGEHWKTITSSEASGISTVQLFALKAYCGQKDEYF